MTLALSLGISIGVKRSLHMMWGELIGVGLVATSAALGVATLMLKYPDAFLFLKLGGGAYLCWIGYQMFRSRGKLGFNRIDTRATRAISITIGIQWFFNCGSKP